MLSARRLVDNALELRRTAFAADTASYVAEVGKARKETKAFKDSVDESKGGLDALKKSLGEESALGNYRL